MYDSIHGMDQKHNFGGLSRRKTVDIIYSRNWEHFFPLVEIQLHQG